MPVQVAGLDTRAENLPADLAGAVEPDVPIQRFGTPEEVAALVVYIASKHASYITGHCFHINGGDHFA